MAHASRRLSPALLASSLLLLLAGVRCTDSGAPEPPAPQALPAAPQVVEVAAAGRVLRLELALEPGARQRGLSGRTSLPEGSGMLFAWPRPQPLAMVMRDCPVPIDVAFLDGAGRVVSLHAMPVEPPRRPGESASAYEARLPRYASGAPALFAIELAGGSLAELGVGVGDRFWFDRDAVRARAR